MTVLHWGIYTIHLFGPIRASSHIVAAAAAAVAAQDSVQHSL